ncbi:hypothetical protein LEP1GSC019_0046 [Leptospira interrogans serovar Pyrogenes str. 2006006960]|nr:hypothetical protein LEP1GSC019_0070 [Leptospira interrogans serovar Pyrogenes str. 2006006960]EKR19513.1 hypothetical protein LEP1GSC019_0046 [Leptospira interrogans serovar Pyrogenes str. 2006006960]
MARVLGVSRSGYYKYLNRHKDRSVAPELTDFLQESGLKVVRITVLNVSFRK